MSRATTPMALTTNAAVAAESGLMLASSDHLLTTSTTPRIDSASVHVCQCEDVSMRLLFCKGYREKQTME